MSNCNSKYIWNYPYNEYMKLYRPYNIYNKYVQKVGRIMYDIYMRKKSNNPSVVRIRVRRKLREILNRTFI